MDFEHIAIGDSYTLRADITAEAVAAFAALSGDVNPLHVDDAYAATTSFRRRVVHGMLVSSYVSTVIGVHLPGPGALWAEQTFRWLKPVFIGDVIDVTVAVTHRSEATRSLRVSVQAINQHGVMVMTGEGTVMVVESRSDTRDVDLADRVALITGASRGIGAAVARALGAAGARVIVNYRANRTQAEEVCHSITRAGGAAIAAAGDVLNREAVDAMLDAGARAFGQAVDVLVNNAGAPTTARPFAELEWADMQTHLDVQIRGAFNCTKAALPGMLARGSGRIVNVGSTMASDPPPNLAGYVVAKAGLRAFTRALAIELGPRGVRVNMVSPGMTETDLIADVPERLRKLKAMQTPLRRLAAADDVAEAVRFLCSRGAEYVTGVDLPIAGGLVM